MRSIDRKDHELKNMIERPTPAHVAIIMDGNGRWAEKRHLPRIMGHRAGVQTVESIVRTASNKGISFLSLYAFSSENWRRPKEEISALISLFRLYFKSKAEELKENDVRIRFAGRRHPFPSDLIDIMDQAEETTLSCKKMQLILCLNYGGRQEIMDALQRMILEAAAGKELNISEDTFRDYLYLPDVPDPDLIIRTSGELRLSNFWLWQSSYSEFYFSDILWPDFNEDEFSRAIESYTQRNRRYGTV